MVCFRIDESGYTGFDLLSSEQRFQGATAIAIEDDDAAALIRHHFPRLQAPELKYSSLSRRPSNHRPLLALLWDQPVGDARCADHRCAGNGGVGMLQRPNGAEYLHSEATRAVMP